MFTELCDLEKHGARVFVVEQDEVKNGGHVRHQVVTRAEGDGAVRHFEHDFEHAGIFGVRRMQGGVEERAQVNGAFDAKSHVEEAPGLGARHIFARQPVKGGQSHERLVQDIGGVTGQNKICGGRGEQAAKLVEHAPHVV